MTVRLILVRQKVFVLKPQGVRGAGKGGVRHQDKHIDGRSHEGETEKKWLGPSLGSLEL